MRRFQMFGLTLALCFLAGCSGCNNSEQSDRLKVEKQQQQYAKAQPVPYFDHSMERDAAIQLYKLRNERVRTWSVWTSKTGVILGHAETIGYPLPYGASLTNPMQPFTTGSGAVVGQAEPNGLFTNGVTTNATWIRQVVKRGGKTMEVPLYIEQDVMCYPYPVVVDYDKNRVTPVPDGEVTAELKSKQ